MGYRKPGALEQLYYIIKYKVRGVVRALRLRLAVCKKRKYCRLCGKPASVVHHKIHLTPHNIDNPSITLSEDNLELLCRECHIKKHERSL